MKKIFRKQPVQRRAQATCDAILDATVQLLARDGLQRLTTGRVAERAGVSVGTLYQYYVDKSALIAAVRGRYVSILVQVAQSELAHIEGLDKRTLVRKSLIAFLKAKKEHLPLARALIELAGVPELGDTTEAANGRFATLLMPLITDSYSQQRKFQVSRALVAALEGTLTYAVLSEPNWLDEAWFVDFLENLTYRILDLDQETPRL